MPDNKDVKKEKDKTAAGVSAELSEFVMQQERINAQVNETVMMIREDLANFLQQDRVDKGLERDRHNKLCLRQEELDVKFDDLSRKLDQVLDGITNRGAKFVESYDTGKHMYSVQDARLDHDYTEKSAQQKDEIKMEEATGPPNTCVIDQRNMVQNGIYNPCPNEQERMTHQAQDQQRRIQEAQDEQAWQEHCHERRNHFNRPPRHRAHHGDRNNDLNRMCKLVATLPKFNGTGSWDGFITSFEKLVRKFEVSDEEKLELLQICLQEQASKFEQALPIAVRANYAQYVERLQARYGEDRDATTARMKLHGIRQTVTETEDEFSERLEQLTELAYPNGNQDMKNDIIVHEFLRGCLNEKAAFVVATQQPAHTTLAQVLRSYKAAISRQQAILGKTETVRRANDVADSTADRARRGYFDNRGSSDSGYRSRHYSRNRYDNYSRSPSGGRRPDGRSRFHGYQRRDDDRRGWSNSRSYGDGRHNSRSRWRDDSRGHYNRGRRDNSRDHDYRRDRRDSSYSRWRNSNSRERHGNDRRFDSGDRSYRRDQRNNGQQRRYPSQDREEKRGYSPRDSRKSRYNRDYSRDRYQNRQSRDRSSGSDKIDKKSRETDDISTDSDDSKNE